MTLWAEKPGGKDNGSRPHKFEPGVWHNALNLSTPFLSIPQTLFSPNGAVLIPSNALHDTQNGILERFEGWWVWM